MLIEVVGDSDVAGINGQSFMTLMEWQDETRCNNRT